MVDLEQFREAVEQWKMLAQVGEVVEAMPVAFRKKPEEYTARIAEADRLLSIIDSAGEVEKEPSAVRSLVDAANAVLALYPGDDLLWTLESAVRPFNAAKPAECAKECPPQQVCDYCQIASTAKQPAAAPDEAARLLAICQNAHDRLLRGDDDSELLAILEQAWNAREAVESP